MDDFIGNAGDKYLEPKQRLLKTLRDLKDSKDIEEAHCDADAALLEFINDKDITEAFNSIEKWYA